MAGSKLKGVGVSESFYKAFEAKHRGPRQEILRRLRVYLPFVLPIAQAHPEAQILDLGCGRGEWLELLKDEGLTGNGVDLDVEMLHEATHRGLDVQSADALQTLTSKPDQSCSIISAIHLVEHLTFDNVQAMVASAHRALVPGGLLIMETPNPDNLRVGSCNFYLDPSHIKPIPSQLLSFLTEYVGFEQITILGLQDNPFYRHKDELHLEDVLAGASPDYAVVAQKIGNKDLEDLLKSVFQRKYGVSTSELAQTYIEQQNKKTITLEKFLKELQNKFDVELNELKVKSDAELNEVKEKSDVKLNELNVKFDAELNELKVKFDAELNELKAKLLKTMLNEENFNRQLQAIKNSFLWSVAKPFQWFIDQFLLLKKLGFKSRMIALNNKLRQKIKAEK